MDNIRKYLDGIISIEDSDWNFFTSKLEERTVKKRTKLLNIDEIENHISFISSGIVHFLIPKEEEDKEVTFGFCFDNEFVSAYDSFLTRKPSLYELETLTDVTMWSILIMIFKKCI